MKVIALISAALLLSAISAGAQTPIQNGESTQADDATQTNIQVQDVFGQLSDSLKLSQSEEVKAAMANHIARNSRRTALGITDQQFRIRIFFDNSQEARSASEDVTKRFKELFPGVAVNRTYDKPFFKVTVGNYSTKAEANAALKRMLPEFPSAFIVRK